MAEQNEEREGIRCDTVSGRKVVTSLGTEVFVGMSDDPQESHLTAVRLTSRDQTVTSFCLSYEGTVALHLLLSKRLEQVRPRYLERVGAEWREIKEGEAE